MATLESPFALDEYTGILKVTHKLNATNSYNLRIIVADILLLENSTLYVYINVIPSVRRSLSFESNPNTFFAPENHPTMKPIGRIRSYSNTEAVKYSIMESSARKTFRINQKTGELFTKQPLDYELTNKHSFHVIAECSSIKNITKITIIVQVGAFPLTS